MNTKKFLAGSSLIFLVAALLHILRVIYNWEVVVGSLSISTGLSWLMAGFFLVLSIIGFYLSRKQFE